MTPELAHFNIGGRDIAYRLRTGRAPTLMFLPGYASDMEGNKAVAMDAFAERRGLGLLRFDYSGTGSSSGRFQDGTLELWLEESLAALERLTEGPVILVGSSMGGWLALHLALLRPDRVQALIGIAAAPDFTDWGFADGGTSERQGISRGLWESGQRLRLLGGDIPQQPALTREREAVEEHERAPDGERAREPVPHHPPAGGLVKNTVLRLEVGVQDELL